MLVSAYNSVLVVVCIGQLHCCRRLN